MAIRLQFNRARLNLNGLGVSAHLQIDVSPQGLVQYDGHV